MKREYEFAELDKGFEFKEPILVPDYEPPETPERPVAHISERCEGCPYPGHGFICWSRDGDCMRQRMERIGKGGQNHGTSSSEQQ